MRLYYLLSWFVVSGVIGEMTCFQVRVTTTLSTTLASKTLDWSHEVNLALKELLVAYLVVYNR